MKIRVSGHIVDFGEDGGGWFEGKHFPRNRAKGGKILDNRRKNGIRSRKTRRI